MPNAIDTGLALAGGGYRAMLFNLGSLWRLNELGWLRRLDMITSVSGGSILNGVLATRWARLHWDASGMATNFVEEIAHPVQQFATRTVDLWAGLQGLLSPTENAAAKLARAYDRHLFQGAQLQADTPAFAKGATPRFLFYATSLHTGASVRIERQRLADYRVGEITAPELPIASIVAASSSFPPFLSPTILRLDPDRWTPLEGADQFKNTALKRRLVLTDGGVYDNMGLEILTRRCSTLLVSDAGAPLDVLTRPPRLWLSQTLRVMDIITEQTRALRRRALMQSVKGLRDSNNTLLAPPWVRGAYWSVKTKIGDYQVPNALAPDSDTTRALQNVRTRLNRFSKREQGLLINWGYALTDAAMRRHLLSAPVAPGSLPYLQFRLD